MTKKLHKSPIHPSPVDAASSSIQEAQDHEFYNFLDRNYPVEERRGNLPHWRQDAVTYFVTFRTADSIPQEKLYEWRVEKQEWQKTHPEPHDDTTKQHYARRFTQRMEKWLDQGYGECLLRRPELKAIVEEALHYFDRSRYALHDFVVMPNHVHVIMTPFPEHELSEIMHSWKSYTGKAIQKKIGRTGSFWQKEFFDHIVRDWEQLERFRKYIAHHPGSNIALDEGEKNGRLD